MKSCKQCGFGLSPTNNPYLELDPLTNKCKGKCGDSKRLSYEVFNLLDVDLEECDNGNIPDMGCFECKVTPGWRCNGGGWDVG